MKRPYSRRALAGAMFMTAMATTAAPARAPQLAGIAKIEPGEWQLRESGVGTGGRSICVADAGVLLQLGHPGAQCSRFVIADSADGTTIHYTCPGAGHGRTVIAVESSHIIDLQTQGIAGGAPFDHHYEGRRIGACTPH
jgi:hypothetical protein